MIVTATEAGPNEAARPRSGVRAWARADTRALVALLLMALLYVGALVLMPPQALTHHDEGAKYLQVRNLRITSAGLDWSINYPARKLDPRLEFAPFHPKQHYVDGQGRIYLQWPIFLGLLTRIFWKTLGFWGLYVVPLLAGLGTLWLSYLLALAVGLPRRVAWLAVPLVGLCTPLPLYSLLYFEHTLASLLVAGSMLAAVKALRSEVANPRWAALSAVLLAVGVYFRSELYVLALVMFCGYVVASWRKRAWGVPAAWLAGFVVALVPLWGFYAVSEGTLLPTHALWYFSGGDSSSAGGVPTVGLPPLRYIANVGWGVVPAFLFGPSDAPLAPTFPLWVEAAGLLGAGLCLVSSLARLTRVRLLSAGGWLGVFAAGLGLLMLSTAATLLSSQAYYNLHGFLLAGPFVALALWPGAIERSRPRGFLYGVTWVYVGLHALVISALSGLGPISLHEWGQRYLLPAYPLLAVLALLAGWQLWQSAGERVGRRVALSGLALAVVLALVGVGFTARGYIVLRDEREQVAQWNGLVHGVPQGMPIVTDTWWLPLNLASEFYAHPMMLAQGDSRLTQWAGQMRSEGVAGFALVTADPTTLTGDWLHRVPGIQPDGSAEEVSGVWLQRYRFGYR